MEDFSKYSSVKPHYKSVLEELVMTHGGQRAREEYKKLVGDKAHYKEIAQLNIDKYFKVEQDKARLVKALKYNISVECSACGLKCPPEELNCQNVIDAEELIKEMEAEG